MRFSVRISRLYSGAPIRDIHCLFIDCSSLGLGPMGDQWRSDDQKRSSILRVLFFSRCSRNRRDQLRRLGADAVVFVVDTYSGLGREWRSGAEA
eukprot:1378629-Amorphochlora_amoeboformis.AAC.1